MDQTEDLITASHHLSDIGIALQTLEEFIGFHHQKTLEDHSHIIHSNTLVNIMGSIRVIQHEVEEMVELVDLVISENSKTTIPVAQVDAD